MIPESQVLKNQHHVWQYHLAAWTRRGKFWCYRQKARQFLFTRPKAVASETYFYRLHELTDADEKFIEHFISRASSPLLRDLNTNFLHLFKMVYSLREQLKDINLPSGIRAKITKELETAEKNLGEHYHSRIENRSKDLLDMLRNQNDSFYHSDDRCIDFFIF